MNKNSHLNEEDDESLDLCQRGCMNLREQVPNSNPSLKFLW